MSEDTVLKYDRRNAWLSLKITLFKVGAVEAMLYGCSTLTIRTQDVHSLRAAHHKLLLRVIRFLRKDRTGHKPLSYGEALKRTDSKRIDTSITKRLLESPGPLCGKATQVSLKRIMFGRLVVQGPKRGGQPATSWRSCFQEISRASRRSRAKAKEQGCQKNENVF